MCAAQMSAGSIINYDVWKIKHAPRDVDCDRFLGCIRIYSIPPDLFF